MRGNPSRVELFYAAKLIWFEARSVSDYVLDSSCPPVTQLTRGSSGRLTVRFIDWILFRLEITGGVMRAVDFPRQWITLDVALRYRFA
jgi:hypothetical protein